MTPHIKYNSLAASYGCAPAVVFCSLPMVVARHSTGPQGQYQHRLATRGAALDLGGLKKRDVIADGLNHGAISNVRREINITLLTIREHHAYMPWLAWLNGLDADKLAQRHPSFLASWLATVLGRV